MKIRQLATILTILICVFATYNFGKYLEPLIGLLFTSMMGIVGCVIINSLAAKEKMRQP